MQEKLLHFVEYESCDLALRRRGEGDFPRRGDERDGVVGRVEADAGLRDVVEDEQVGALALELRAGSVDAAVARLSREADDDLAVAPRRAERGENVGGGLELERPRLGVLRALRGER